MAARVDGKCTAPEKAEASDGEDRVLESDTEMDTTGAPPVGQGSASVPTEPNPEGSGDVVPKTEPGLGGSNIIQEENPAGGSSPKPAGVLAQEPTVPDGDSSDGSTVRAKTKRKRKRKRKITSSPETPATEEVAPTEADRLKAVADRVAKAEAEGWSVAESRANRRLRAKAAHVRLNLCLRDDDRENLSLTDLIQENGKMALPAPHTVDGSDDEDWLTGDSHPIDWYLVYLRAVLDGNKPNIHRSCRPKLKYAWKNYVPGDPCPYVRCQRLKGTATAAKRWPNLLKFARHLVEKHMNVRPYLYCVSGSSSTSCPEYSDGELFRCQRRADLVRHLCDNKGVHKRTISRGVEAALKVWGCHKRVGNLHYKWRTNRLKQWNYLTEADWERLCKGAKCEQTDLGPDTEIPMPTVRKDTPPKKKDLKRGRQSSKDDTKGGRDRSRSEPAKKRAATATVTSEVDSSQTVGTITVSSVALPPVADQLPRQERKKLGDALAIVQNSLGDEQAGQVAADYVKQYKWSQKQKKASAPQESVSPVSDAEQVEVQQPDGASAQPTAPPQHGATSDPARDDEVTPVPEHRAVDEGLAGLPVLPGDGPAFDTGFSDTLVPGFECYRAKMAENASKLLQFQVSFLEKSYFEQYKLLREQAIREGKAWVAERTRVLAEREASLEQDHALWRATIEQLESRLTTCDAKFFWQFGLKLTEWERTGFPDLQSRLGLAARPAPPVTPVLSVHPPRYEMPFSFMAQSTRVVSGGEPTAAPSTLSVAPGGALPLQVEAAVVYTTEAPPGGSPDGEGKPSGGVPMDT